MSKSFYFLIISWCLATKERFTDSANFRNNS